ncbi:MAG: asparagine synthase C-terminal domain-containing protein [Thermoplasmata archaeon]
MVGPETLVERLDSTFDRALAPWRSSPEPLTILFSGGVDSSLIAWELRGHPHLVLSTVGTSGSRDLVAAEEGARLLNLCWRPSVVTAEDVRELARKVDSELDGLSPVRRSVLVAFAAAVARAPEGSLLCGQGADELFLGYGHYRGLGPGEAERRSTEDLDQAVSEDWPRSVHIARKFGRDVHAPYLNPGFVAAARSIPIEQRLPSPEPKAYFREWARHRQLPELLAGRPKRALQYGSGVDRIVSGGP